jgi:hypothetical protein
MTDYVTSALFVHTDDTRHLVDPSQHKSLGTRITAVAFDEFMQTLQDQLEGVDHIVVAGSLRVIMEILRLGMKYHFSIGMIPTKKQKHLTMNY